MSSSAGMLIIYVVAFIAIFYFMAIRPQQRQRRAHQTLLSSLKKGDHIITASGIYGTVKRVEESVIVVEVAKGVSVKISRRAVAEIIRDAKDARAFAPEPTGRRGKNAPLEIEEETSAAEETYVDEASEEPADVAESAAAEAEEEETVLPEEESPDRKKQA